VGQDPWASTSGTRGLAALALSTLFFGAAAVAALPFVFLMGLPLMLGQPILGFVSIPLALAGTGGAYFMLVSAAARMLEAREPELVARILAEE
jgi:hypothetical protein